GGSPRLAPVCPGAAFIGAGAACPLSPISIRPECRASAPNLPRPRSAQVTPRACRSRAQEACMEELAHPAGTAATAPPATPTRWGFARRFLAVFTAPRALFENLREYPSWVVPTLVLGVVTLVAT